MPVGRARRDVVDQVRAALADRDFFIRKAIGWALRELSPLSAREALRKISR